VARTVAWPGLFGRAARAEVARLARENAQLREEIARQEASVGSARAERDAADAALRAARATVEDLRESLDALRADARRATWGNYADEPHPVAYELITVADRLGDLTGSTGSLGAAADAATSSGLDGPGGNGTGGNGSGGDGGSGRGGGDGVEPAQAAAVARWIGNRLRMMLARCDVAPDNRTGPVDLVRQEIVGWRAAPTPNLVDHIAETVRPGYSWRGQVLRTQQVIIYVAPATEAAEPSPAETKAHDPDSPR
jgi:molecular chaperone GrpE (heat shock protein)